MMETVRIPNQTVVPKISRSLREEIVVGEQGSASAVVMVLTGWNEKTVMSAMDQTRRPL